jgi:hypothetical protein
MVTLELNENQSQVLVQLLDLAVKAGGLNVAEAATFFANKIKESQPESSESVEVEE